MSTAIAVENPKIANGNRRIRRPRTLGEYLNYDPRDGFKYEWVNGKLIKRAMLKKEHYYIINSVLEISNHNHTRH